MLILSKQKEIVYSINYKEHVSFCWLLLQVDVVIKTAHFQFEAKQKRRGKRKSTCQDIKLVETSGAIQSEGGRHASNWGISQMKEGVPKAALNSYVNLFQYSPEFGSDCHKLSIAAYF